ncbi:TonB-dependent receptor [Microbacter margulisiae]|uniref:TonB-dependent receptor plug domain-containing protein n=1 Tax=Microbacter margulisiae TaxID=1350067 RepID=A0A7W5H325_9PORP|nr:TonB-dependent receptor [Microbacter margulisiae]MBB3188046.1 hypothetical protein [Microbacter margulisiae]
MIRYVLWIFCFIIFIHPKAHSQKHYTISGFVTDAETGESLIGAIITVQEMRNMGTVSNSYGFYSLTLPAGNYQITVQYIGYASHIQQIRLTNSTKANIFLTPKSNALQEVIVTNHRTNENIIIPQMGMQKINTKKTRSIPVLFGEQDIMKTIQLLPGVEATGDGGSQFNVRGGSPGQNLILLDEAPIYNASHLMGFFSVFNSDAIKNVTVYKGNEPAEYGGRLASVVDLQMDDGDNKNFRISGGIGLISSRVTIQGPIVKNKGSFIISARRTYADMFLKLSKDTTLNQSRLYFYDINAKANYAIDDKNHIYLSGYLGRDALGLANIFGINWGNKTITLRWNHLFSDKIFTNTDLIFSNYDYKINLDNGEDNNIISRIQDYNFKQDYQYYISERSTLRFGIQSTYHNIVPGIITSTAQSCMQNLSNKHALESALYFSHKYTFNQNISIEYGIRASVFNLFGPGNFYSYDTNGNITDTICYNSAQIVKSYFNIEPRATLNYIISKSSSMKAAYARNTQNLHLLSNSTSSDPIDLWIPSSNNVKPEISDQVSLGYYHNMQQNQYEFSAEVYYKKLQNQIDYRDGAQLNFNENVESQLLYGKGRAYGLEIFLKKRTGKFNGWISYTLSRSENKFDAINNGRYFPTTQDRTHNINIVGIYNLNKKWTLSATWIYETGNAVTFPSGKYQIDAATMFYYSNRNANRMPAYSRLDLGATWIAKKTNKFQSSWTFSIYNAYGRNNPYIIRFENDKTDPTKTDAVQTTLFKFVPSVSYNFRF